MLITRGKINLIFSSQMIKMLRQNKEKLLFPLNIQRKSFRTSNLWRKVESSLSIFVNETARSSASRFFPTYGYLVNFFKKLSFELEPWVDRGRGVDLLPTNFLTPPQMWLSGASQRAPETWLCGEMRLFLWRHVGQFTFSMCPYLKGDGFAGCSRQWTKNHPFMHAFE